MRHGSSEFRNKGDTYFSSMVQWGWGIWDNFPGHWWAGGWEGGLLLLVAIYSQLHQWQPEVTIVPMPWVLGHVATPLFAVVSSASPCSWPGLKGLWDLWTVQGTGCLNLKLSSLLELGGPCFSHLAKSCQGFKPFSQARLGPNHPDFTVNMIPCLFTTSCNVKWV